MAHLSILDGVRAVAVLLVVVCHLMFEVHGGTSPSFYDFHAVGHLGVAIFFVHTSLVLMGSLERHGSAPIPFYVRRIFRIYPLSITVVLFIAAIQLAWPERFDVGRFLSNLFLIQNLTGDSVYSGPMWSLPYEVQMYVFLPALYFVITRTKRPVFSCSLIYVTSVILALLDPSDLGSFKLDNGRVPLIRYAPCFTAGTLAFALSGRITRGLHPAWLAVMILVGVVLVPQLVSVGVPEIPLSWAFCLVIALMIPASRELTCQPIARASKTVATYSYGAYLTHLFAFSALQGLLPGPTAVQWAGMLILLAGLPYICYHGIEKRGVSLGERIAARCGRRSRKTRPSAATSEAP